MGETSFVAFLTSDDRIRHHHFSAKGGVREFTIQYEAFILGKWHRSLGTTLPMGLLILTECIQMDQ